MPSPGGQASGMDVVRHPLGLPEGLPHGVPGAELKDLGQRLRRGLPPGHRAVGRCQAEGMMHELQRRDGANPSERPLGVRHVTALAGTNVHATLA